MIAKPHTLLAKCLLALCFFLCFSLSTQAQVEPDTVKRKPALPTGPPGTEKPVTTPKPQPQPKPQTQPTPPAPQPEVKQEAEPEQPLEFIDKLYFGGSIGLQFGSYTNISLLPILSYKITPKFGIGAGPVYHFIKDGDFTLNNYGGRGFAQVEVIEVGGGAVMAHAEVESLSREYLVEIQPYIFETRRKTLVMPMLGVGYRQRITEKASFDIMLLYNTNDDPVNPYSNPVIRAGINLPFRK
ncbi:hypothetical protein WG947_00365 [Pontibacter sp. H259]|uniref:hypothetical protein n=1 Tax=Pontibacter sp. H259 TaxID=3133421 RepID=UPI0030BA5C73